MVVETWLLLPLALGWLLWHDSALTTQADFWSTPAAAWLLLTGPITLVPLLCFNAAARQLPYATLGFLQYIAPTLVLLQAVLLYDEPLSGGLVAAAVLIGIGIALVNRRA